MGLFGCLACLGMGGSAYAGTGDGRGVIFDNLSQRLVTMHPSEKPEGPAMAENEIRGGMLFVPPRPDVNYKIGKVTPNQGIVYKIQILTPKLRSWLEEIIQKDVPRE